MLVHIFVRRAEVSAIRWWWDAPGDDFVNGWKVQWSPG